MDHAVRDPLSLHPKKPPKINQKVDPKLSWNLTGDILSAPLDHAMELWDAEALVHFQAQNMRKERQTCTL